MVRMAFFLVLAMASVGAIEFDFSNMGPRWSPAPLPPDHKKPDGTIIEEVYLRDDHMFAMIRISKPMHPDGFEASFRAHALLAQQSAADATLSRSEKPRKVELRKIGGEYLVTLVNPGAPGMSQVLFSVYRPGGVEQMLVESPEGSEQEAFFLAKEVAGLPKLEDIPVIRLESLPEVPRSGSYSEGYRQGRELGPVLFSAFALIAGGVLIVFLLKRRNQPEEQFPNSYVSFNQHNSPDPDVSSDCDSSDS